MKVCPLLLFVHLSIVLSKPIAKPNEVQPSQHHFEKIHVESNNEAAKASALNAIEEKQSDSAIDEKLEAVEAERVEEKKEVISNSKQFC